MKLNNILSNINSAYRLNKRNILASLVMPSLIMSLAVMINQLRGITIGFLTRDPNAISGIPYYAGFISQIGIFFWAGTAAICAFTSHLLWKQPKKSEMTSLLLFAGFLTTVLGADDVFQMHEGFFPQIGIPENLVLVSYVLLLIYFLYQYSELILKTNFLLLFISLGFFGLSMIVDVLFLFENVRHLLEDGFKLFGIATWAAYFTGVCATVLRARIAKD